MNARNPLLLTLIVLQIATLAYLFMKPATQDGSAGRTFVIEGTDGSRAASTAELRTELRAIVRSEITALGSAAPARSVNTDTGPVSEQELQMKEQASAASGEIIHQAISARIWTREDTRALLPHIGKLDEGQRMALVEEFYSAINRQELKLEDFPPL